VQKSKPAKPASAGRDQKMIGSKMDPIIQKPSPNKASTKVLPIVPVKPQPGDVRELSAY
jgi:hypothetical protein